MTMPDPKTAILSGRALSWREKGEGTALVLIHGTGGSSELWEAQFDRFPDQYRVIAWDAPGYGLSDPWGSPPTADDYARLLASFLDSRGVATAHLVGQSVGAILAAGVCRLNPTSVLSATFLHPITGLGGLDAADRDEQRAKRLAGVDARGMAAFVEDWAPTVLGSAAGPEVLEAALRIMRDIPEATYRDMVEIIATGDLLSLAAKVRAPSLVIGGGDDGIAPEPMCRAVAETLPKAEFVMLDGIGHYLPAENPGLFHRTMTAFLADKADTSTYF